MHTYLLSCKSISRHDHILHPGVAEISAPVGGPGSDIINEGLKLYTIRETIAGCKMVPNIRCKMGAYNIFTKI